MNKALEALENIKLAPTIYCGCGSDIYTRYSFECKEIETALKRLEKQDEILRIIKEKNCLLEGLKNVNHQEFDLLKETFL